MYSKKDIPHIQILRPRREILKDIVSLLQFVLVSSIANKGRLIWSMDITSPLQDSNLSNEINRSLSVLAQRQNEDGSFGSEQDLFGRDPAVAALCGLAFMAAGSQFNRGKYGSVVKKITDFLLDSSFISSNNLKYFTVSSKGLALEKYLLKANLTQIDVEGLFADFRERGCKPLYGHGYALLFLAEVFGTISSSKEIIRFKDCISSAVNLLVRIQNNEGGWRYEPKIEPLADISVTTCILIALKAVKNAGLYVPSDTISRAVAYIKKLQNPDGGFRYTSLEGESGYGRTAASFCVLYSTEGAKDKDKVLIEAYQYLKRVYPPKIDEKNTSKIEYWIYSQFYATLARWYSTVNISSPEEWKNFMYNLRKDLLSRQNTDGLWESNISTEAETALALCTLLITREGLPFFLH